MRDKYTLGLNFLHSDTSACIFKDNELIAAAEEERFTRVKHTSNFPLNSINFCIEQAKISLSDITTVSINSNPYQSLYRKIFYVLKNPRSIILTLNSLNNLKKKTSLKKLIQSIDPNNKFSGNIKYIDHHESHIASSLFFSKFNECVNLSLDGFGDFSSSAWGLYKNDKFKIDKRIFFPHSLGIFYQAITQFLGFKKYGDEYKVMGLASYGNPIFKNKISELVKITNNGFKLNLKYFVHHKSNIINKQENGQIIYDNLYSKKLLDLLGRERLATDEINQIHKDIARSAQEVYEDIFISLLNKLYSKYKINNLTLSGGCIMNSVANGKILEKTEFKNIYISPNPGDAGGSIGSAASLIKKNNKEILNKNTYSFLGNEYTDDNIETILKENSLSEKFHIQKITYKKIIEETANSLQKSLIVGWFQGKMEWGPRALGNRSILADPRNPDIKNILNIKIKRRESFRPFAPSILVDFVNEWFEINSEVPYMSEVYPVRSDKRSILPAITHVDGTGRLQTVKKSENKKYYDLISKFNELTSVPVLLNTSFNENEPIVRTPQEALNCFLRTNMDVLVLGNWMIKRS